MATPTVNADGLATAPAAVSTGGAAILAMLIGLGVVMMAGFVQADALHVAAHDMRHATGFPCH